ncbi:hypothetical protein T06_11908 [Trichinella sp. T6]|nr:hypothetical protein T06_11908 [Trichinella sp. T6]
MAIILAKRGVDSMDARIEDFCCIRKTNRYTMLMLYFIVEVCINNAFLLMRHQQTFQLVKHIEMSYQNEKIYAQTTHNFIRYGVPQDHKCYRYEL